MRKRSTAFASKRWDTVRNKWAGGRQSTRSPSFAPGFDERLAVVPCRARKLGQGVEVRFWASLERSVWDAAGHDPVVRVHDRAPAPAIGRPTFFAGTGQGWTAWWAARQQDLGMRGLCTDRIATVIIAGRAFVQNLRRGHYELALDVPPARRVAAGFTELAQAI